MLHEFAPAKLNLYLHVTGRRADGYHDLDSLVAFAGIGDELRLEPAPHFSFVIEGPQAPALEGHPPDNNLVVKAAHALAELVHKPLALKLTLVKILPVASGIGGGSSDAAAALRLLARYWGLKPNDQRLTEAALPLGQDVPVCLTIENNYITTTGTSAAPPLPKVGVVLVNPNKALPTPAVYATYRDAGYPFSPKAQLTDAPANQPSLIAALLTRGNDLYRPACDLMPEIKEIVRALDRSGSLLARMSGSGATCFGLYDSEATAQKVAGLLKAHNPTWWVMASTLPWTNIL